MNFSYKISIQGGLLLLALSGQAFAQDSVTPYSLTLGREQYGDGIRLSESALLHVGVGAEAGYDTNVFYTGETPVDSAVLNVTPFFSIGNGLRRGTEVASRLVYQFGASLTYREYLNEDPNVKAQRGFSPSVTLGLSASGAKVGFNFNDTFARIEEPSYGVSSETIKRNHNLAQIQLRFSPGGGRIQDSIGYRNLLDAFDDLQYANNMGHEVWNDLSWKWLPKTAFYLRLLGGYTHYLTEDPAFPRNNSLSVGGNLGLRGLVTPKLTVDVSAGYATAFYENDTQVSGLANFAAALTLGYRLTPFTGISLGYARGFKNSPLIGDYYDLDTVSLIIDQAIGGKLVIGLEGRYEYRRYKNYFVMMMPFDRRDHIIIGGAKMDYFIQKWFYAGIGYALTFNESNNDVLLGGAPLLGVDYTKHQILGRMGITY
jgi:opacity protein-like surface antigen